MGRSPKPQIESTSRRLERPRSGMTDKTLPGNQPELLAPAGDWDCVRAAVENGADAIYFGLQTGFNARARATNFEVSELPRVMEHLHHRGLRGYVTLNTLVFVEELHLVEELVRRLVEHGVDAVLVQDLGVVRLIRELTDDLAIHASTQMTLTSAECIEAVAALGISRVVLPRELSLDEIAQVHAGTSIELEAFVHGALCVAYSGQCLTSESLGGRSANRGQCAQACRLPFDLVCDGKDVELGDVRYLLSPQDLAAYELVPQLLAAGVGSLKIEGRLKSAEYVANITAHYRRALDSAVASRPASFSETDRREMEMSFSRGFSSGWLEGINHKELVPGLSSAKRGVLVGEVVSVGQDRVTVQVRSPLAAGDGVVFAGDRVAGDEQGGRVYHLFRNRKVVPGTVSAGRIELTFRSGAIDFGQLRRGQQVWKTDDPALTKRLRKTFQGDRFRRKTPVNVEVTAIVGQPLHVVGRRPGVGPVSIVTEHVLEQARKHAVTEQLLTSQLGRLGNTPYALSQLTARIEGDPMVPLSVLGKARRALVTALDASSQRSPGALKQTSPLDKRIENPDVPGRHPARSTSRPQIQVLCRTMDQLGAALDTDVDGVIVDFADIRRYKQAATLARSRGVALFVATPRIQKPNRTSSASCDISCAPIRMVCWHATWPRFASSLRKKLRSRPTSP